jgi:tetratricopeptide (TPR) repeat protein
VAVGATFGRYVIIERIGAGGMGVVWKAYDPELDRRVALKLVRLDRGRDVGSDDPTRADEPRERLLREAQAMAKLAHPNVIAVHDVGTLGDEVYVAMELVDGPNLAAWLRGRRRPWREILHAFVQAGRGLAAAHAANLVHRDFKPDNVLVGGDGRVRVTDFGLSRALDQPERPTGASPASDRLFDSLTTTGAVVGTPAFMSPEQHLGRATDPRSDQFSFCVALYEALAGQRPFAAANIHELTRAVVAGAIREPPPGRMPRFVRRALVRGLAPRPDDRFPSMDALLAALGRDPRPLRRGVVAGVAVAAVACAAIVLARRAPECASAGRLAGVWDAERRQAVHKAFAATGAGFAEDAWRSAAATIDAYADALAAMHHEACEATRVRGEQSAELLDLRMDCLAGRVDDLGALVTLFSRPDRGIVERAPTAAAGLRDLAECADKKQLLGRAHPPRDPAWRARADELRRGVAEVHALKLLGRFTDGLARAEALAAPAAALGDRSLEAGALTALGDLQSRAGDPVRAEATLADAVRAALAGSDARAAAEADIQLAVVVGMELRQTARGLEALKTAAALVESMGGDPLFAAKLAGAEGQILIDAGRAKEALPSLERARALFEELRGPDDIDVATAWNDVGGAYRMLGRFPDALAAHARALAIRERALGPGHPFVATSLTNIGNVYFVEGRYADAQPYFERSLAIWETMLGPDHPRVAEGLVSLAENFDSLGRADEALAALRRAQAIQERALAPDDPEVGRTLNALGDVERRLGQHERALAAYRGALAIKEKRLGPEHASVAISVYSVADALLALDRNAEALAGFQRALAIDTKVVGADGVELAFDLTGIGHAQLQLGRPADAIPPLERALALRVATPGDPVDRAETEFMLARALWDAGRDRDRALALAGRARAAYAAAGEGARADLAAIDAWLRAHPLVRLR